MLLEHAATLPLAPNPLEPRDGETLDSICGGLVQILQRGEGYRFNLDALLLAHFAAASATTCGRPTYGGALMDLGTGSGIVALLLAKRFGFSSVCALELQETLFKLASRNIRLNRCEQRVSVRHGDLRCVAEHFPPGSFTSVVCNPPYRPVRTGRQCPDPEKAVARHELECDVEDVCKAARHLLSPGGTFSVVFPASRLAQLLAVMRAQKLEPRRLCFVHPVQERPAKLLLLDAVKAGRADLSVLPPLVLHERAGGPFTAVVQAMVDGTDVPRPDFA